MGKEQVKFPCHCNQCASNNEKGFLNVTKRTRRKHEELDPKAADRRRNHDSVPHLGKRSNFNHNEKIEINILRLVTVSNAVVQENNNAVVEDMDVDEEMYDVEETYVDEEIGGVYLSAEEDEDYGNHDVAQSKVVWN